MAGLMITKQQLISLCRHETNVIQHLAASLPDGGADWRPTPDQRSTLELLQYMTSMAEILAVYLVKGGFEHATAMSEKSKEVTLDTFAHAMDNQLGRVSEWMAEIDFDAASTKMIQAPWQEEMAQSEVIMRTVYGTYVAYRMQLFLYAKQAGNKDLGTFDCWLGRSAR